MINVQESIIKENRVVPVTHLVAHKRTYRKHPETHILKIMRSLERFGQARNIVLQEHTNDAQYTIVAGPGVTQGAVRLGWHGLRADILPAQWSDEQVKAYLVTSGTEDDEIELAQLRQEQVVNVEYNVSADGSSEETFQQMLQAQADKILREDREQTTERATSTYNILVRCTSQIEQQRAYELVQREGFTCRLCEYVEGA